MAHIDRDPSCCLLTSGDIARSLKVDLKTVHRWVRRGALHGQRTRGGHLRFRHVEVVRFLRHRRLRIPDAMRVPSPRVLSVGLPSAHAGPRLEEVRPERLFDALLELAEDDYDVAALGLDDLDLETAVGFVRALRRHEATREVALVVVSHWPERRQALSSAGADLAIGSAQEVMAAVSVVTGTPVSAEHRHAASQSPAAAPLTGAAGAQAYAATGVANPRALAG